MTKKQHKPKTLIQEIRACVKNGTGYFMPISFWLDDDLEIRKYAICKITFPCDIDLFGNMSLINVAKQFNIETFNPKGEWNGYAYKKIRLHAKIKDKRTLNRLIKAYENKPKSKIINEDEREEKWAKRLAKLSGITIEDAKKIAEEKIDYKFDRINAMIERNNEQPSKRRDSLIRKMERENPLRRIEDTDHANAIIAASNRHRYTDYEDKLEEARELAEIGEIDRGDVKEYARINYAR